MYIIINDRSETINELVLKKVQLCTKAPTINAINDYSRKFE